MSGAYVCGRSRRPPPALVVPGAAIQGFEITTNLDHMSHCRTTSGINLSNTYRMFIMNIRREKIMSQIWLDNGALWRFRSA